jgi:hypothetical protein
VAGIAGLDACRAAAAGAIAGAEAKIAAILEIKAADVRPPLR